MVSTQVTTNSFRQGGNTALAVAGVARELRFAKGRCKNPGGPRDGSKQITIDLWNSSPVCSIHTWRDEAPFGPVARDWVLCDCGCSICSIGHWFLN